jgi:putative ABC transport system substrate-binding protein
LWPRCRQFPRAQQAIPTIGFLSTRSPDEAAIHTNASRRGLEEMGYVAGRNVSIEYRWAKGDYGSLKSFNAELAGLPLALIVAVGDPAARAAKTVIRPAILTPKPGDRRPQFERRLTSLEMTS